MGKILIYLIRGYQRLISPLLGHRYRFYPSCSSYAIEAVERFGPVQGNALAVHSILRCPPLYHGGFEPGT